MTSLLRDKPKILLESKKIYRQLKPVTLEEAIYIKDKWHHAILTYLGLTATYNEEHAYIELDNEEIKDIIQFYGVKPRSK
jgi:hypothetical protein